MKRKGVYLCLGLLCVVCAGNLLSAQTTYIVDSPEKGKSFTGVVKKNIEEGDAAFKLEQYVISVDRYQRALNKESRDTVKWRIYYRLGKAQQRLNHAKEAYDAYTVLWDKGEKGEPFLESYAEVLFNLGMYSQAGVIKDTMLKYKMKRADFFDKSLLRIAENADSLISLTRQDIVYDTGLNTPFSEYGMTLVEGDMVLTSTRPIKGETMMDPRTGHAYSRLYTARYRPSHKDWGDVSLLQAPTLKLEGNVGMFSYDSLRNIAYFMWGQANNSGIYTLTRQADGSWGDMALFEFNFDEGKTSFAGRVGHPSISADGNKLLFVLNEVNLGTATDIWLVKRTPKSAKVSPKKRKGVESPSRVAQTRRKTSRKKGSTAVILNSEWELPIRLGSVVNTNARESFPQWIDDKSFAFASDGLMGAGGLDLFVGVFDTNFTKIESVMRLPSPINSSFDDHSLLVDYKHKAFLFSSNRYVDAGRTDNVYICTKTGMVLTIEGIVKDSLSGMPIEDFVVTLKDEAGKVFEAENKGEGKFVFSPMGDGVYTLEAKSDNYNFKTTNVSAQGVKSILPVMAREEIVFELLPEGYEYEDMLADGVGSGMDSTEMSIDSTMSADSVGMSADSTEVDSASMLASLDSVPEMDTIANNASVAEAMEEPLGDSLSESAAAALAAAAEALREQEALEAAAAAAALAAAKAATDLPDNNTYTPFAIAVGSTPKQDLSVYLNDSMSPKQIIDTINRYRKDASRVDTRFVDDYKKRVNDPMRRVKLQVVPPGAKCDVCEDESRRRDVDKPFFIRTNDDKALITMTDQAGKVSYIDLAPNAAYAIEITTTNSAGTMPSLPKSVQMSDVRRTVVTRDYILFECVPKLSELNDEVYINNLYFDFDKDSLIKDATRELDRMIIVAIKNPNMMFEVGAYADERGEAEYNKKLTDRRLESAVSYIERKGFDRERIVGKSYGKTKPIITGAKTEKEHSLNRRITFNLFNPMAQNILEGKPYPLVESMPNYGKKVSFKLQLGAFRQPLENPLDYYADIVKLDNSFEITYYMDKDGLYKYNLGKNYDNIEQVRAVAKKLLDNNRECYIAAFYEENRITVAEALAIIKHGKR